jgi:hypothetical protein
VSDSRDERYENLLYEAHHDASRDYDQAILTLSSGTLALSVTFAHDIAPTPAAGTTTFLALAWVALGVAIIAMVVSFLTSQRTLLDRIADLDKPPEPPSETPASPSLVERLTGSLNIVAGAGFVLGLGLLGAYALANI